MQNIEPDVASLPVADPLHRRLIKGSPVLCERLPIPGNAKWREPLFEIIADGCSPVHDRTKDIEQKRLDNQLFTLEILKTLLYRDYKFLTDFIITQIGRLIVKVETITRITRLRIQIQGKGEVSKLCWSSSEENVSSRGLQ